MRCPSCEKLENKVIDSRINNAGDTIRRRRECLGCTSRFTTFERIEQSMPLVIKKDGRREEFDRQKILSGIQKACQKRPVTAAQLEKTVASIEKKLTEYSLKEIQGRDIGHLVMGALHELDKVAYVRFASVYREFKDVESFVLELQEYGEDFTQTDPSSSTEEKS